MQHGYSDDLLRRTARLYYVDRLGQGDVARLAKVSQAKVSRLLALARERGIVRISVADYEPRHTRLEGQLRARVGLAMAVVVKTEDGLDAADLRRAVGHFAAAAVAALIRPEDMVALAGGRTIHELVRHLPEDPGRSPTVVQAMGSVDAPASAFDAQEVGREMARRLGGTFLALNTPAFVPDKRTRDTLLELEQVRHVHERLGRARVAIVGLGTLANSMFVARGVLPANAIAALRRSGAVGEMCGRFFNSGGSECNTPWRDRVIGMRLEELRRIAQVIGVVSGSDRSEAILAAVKGGILKTLVIDETGAHALLAAIPGTGSRNSRPRKRS